ncbi:hypothetical protein NOMA109596_06760 [Nocardioides marinus]
MVSPASGPLPSTSLIAPEVFFSEIAGKAATGVLVEDVSETLTPLAAVPVVVAVLSTLPASTSPWVRVYVFAVQVTEALGASEPDGQVMFGVEPPKSGSWTVTGFSATFPVFLTVNV